MLPRARPDALRILWNWLLIMVKTIYRDGASNEVAVVAPDLAGTTVSGFGRYSSSVRSLPAGQQAVIGAVAQRISASYRPYARPVTAICLIGHADSDPGRGPAFEDKISADRALQIHAALVRAVGYAISGRVTWIRVGAGARLPLVAQPRTEAERARNRRVDIWLLCRTPGGVNPIDPGVLRWGQRCINRLAGGRLPVDGILGTNSFMAVRGLQSVRGLPPTGLPGLDTIRTLVQACGLPTPVLPAAPPLSSKDNSVAEVTLYVAIPHGDENPAQPLTGIYVPRNCRADLPVNILLYLHGHHRGGQWPPTLTINEYWNRARYPYFALREGVLASGRNVILVAPTLGPTSQSGWLTSSDGLERYIDLVRAALRAYQPRFAAAPAPPELGQIILACHSGGGKSMLSIARGHGAYENRIKQCWGFDCLYNDADPQHWADWARMHPDATLFVHYGNGGTDERSRKLAAIASREHLPNVSVSGSTSILHNSVPIKNWSGRLGTAAFLGSTSP
jgi:hypothetical protein